MAAWEAGNTISKAQAIINIKEMAIAKGFKGAFKVLYNGDIIADPSELPEQVDMSKVQVSAVLHQA